MTNLGFLEDKMSEQTDRIKNSIKLVIHGKDEVIDMVLCAFNT